MSANTSKPNDHYKQARVRYLAFFFIFLLYLIPVIIVFRDGFGDYFQLFRRITGLAGVSSLFIAIILSSFVRQSKKIFGTAYIKVHHLFSIIGLILVTLHPAIMAIDFGTSRIFIPNFSSWNAFLTNAGRPALYLIYIAAIAAVFRRNITKYWKYLHNIIYLAFILGAIHGMRQGSNFSSTILFILYILMIVAVVFNFIYKRYLSSKKS